VSASKSVREKINGVDWAYAGCTARDLAIIKKERMAIPAFYDAFLGLIVDAERQARKDAEEARRTV